MGVGLYSVSCGYGCGYGFGGFASLIAMVLALRAREALRSGGSLRMVMGGKVFSGPSLSWLARRCASSVEIRTHGFALRAKPRVGSCAPNAASPFRASRATPSPPIPQLRLVQGRRNAALWASRFAIPLYLHTPKCAGVKNALRPYRLA